MMGMLFTAGVVAFVYWRYRSWLDAHFRRHASMSLCLLRHGVRKF